MSAAASIPTLRSWDVKGWGLRAVALSYLALLLLLPLAALVQDGFREGPAVFFSNIFRPTAWAALKLTLWTSALMAAVNGVVGTLTAYVLVRYRFFGKSLLNAVVDLPFAIPTLVTGVMLVILYGPRDLLGGFFYHHFEWKILFAPPAIVLALLFVNYPIVVRSVQPVLEELDFAEEEAAATLGASSWRTFWRVVFPAIRPALLSGVLLSFARALGEFGSIVVVAGNLPLRSQTAAVYVWGEIESENRLGASAMSIVLLACSFTLVLVVDWLQRRKGRARG
ncbi:sulfate ABC transporter permease subunit CysT [bacterium]|nr:MAG: sulfate ABC transporter permease subunit CysT [bacterium]